MHGTTRSRVSILTASVGVFAALVALRLLDIQVLRAEQFRDKVARQHRQVIEIDGHRGAILDRAGRELAVSVTTYSLYAHPGRVKQPETAARLLAPILGQPTGKLLARLRSDRPFEWLARRTDPKTARAIRELAGSGLEIGRGKPIDFQEEPKRFYPQGGVAVQVVGFANIDQRGVEGIEKKFDDVLQGDSSRYLALRDGRGGNILHLLKPPSRPAYDVALTLDVVLQHVVERELDRAMDETGARAATAILVDPRTGQVLAMANRPVPDPSNYGAAPVEARRNRAITDVYEPGSTFKVVTTAGALELGTVSPEQRFSCAPVSIGGHVYRDVHEHTVLTVREILEESSNNGIIRVGFTMPRDALRENVVRFGFGRRTGIELPGEVPGAVTPLARMSEQSRASMAMGYEVAATPLQLVAAIAAIANDGVLVPPRIVHGVRGPADLARTDAAEPRRVLTSRTAATLAGMMEGVVVRGTGTAAAVPGYHIAGKTGTAKKFRKGGYTEHEYYSSFAAFGPLRDPRLAGLVVLDTPSRGAYYGGVTAAPALGRIMADALAYLGVPPDGDPWKAREEMLEARAKARQTPASKKRSDRAKRPEPAAPAETEAAVVVGPGQVPDLAGKPLRQAVVTLAALGCRVRVEGAGVVVGQSPAPGSDVPSDASCAVTLGDPPRPAENETALVARSEPSRPTRPRRRR